jgi:hypothetical protein
VSGFSKQYGVDVDNVIIIVMQNLLREVATFHVTEFLADGGVVTRDYSVTPGTTHEEAEKVRNADKYKVRIIQYPDVRHYDTIVSLSKNDKRALNHSAYYYQVVLQRTCTLASKRFYVKDSKVDEMNEMRRGRGLYANVRFKRGSVIGWYPCTPFTYCSDFNQEGEANATGTYRFEMADNGNKYDNYTESLTISKEENSQTGYCDVLNESANTMGLAWLINTDLPKCNTRHEEKLAFHPDEINGKTLLKVRVVFAAEDIEPYTELTIRYTLGCVSARTEAEEIAREKHRRRQGGKGYETPNAEEKEEKGEVREEKEEEKGASTTVSGSGDQVRDAVKRSGRVVDMVQAQQMKDKKKADAELERQHELKVKEEKDADNKKRKKDTQSKKEEEKAEKEAKKMKAGTNKRQRAACTTSVDNVDLIESNKHDTTVVRVAGIPTTVIHTVPPHVLQSKCNNLEILNLNQMKTIQELTAELEKLKREIADLVANQKFEKDGFEEKLLKEKAELRNELESKGKLEAAKIALANAETNLKHDTEKNNRIKALEVQLHGYRVSNCMNERPLMDHASDQQFERRMKRLQQMKSAGLTLDELKYLETSEPCQSQSVTNILSSTIVESAVPFPQSHAIQPLEQNALLAIQQNAVLAIEQNALLAIEASALR